MTKKKCQIRSKKIYNSRKNYFLYIIRYYSLIPLIGLHSRHIYIYAYIALVASITWNELVKR